MNLTGLSVFDFRGFDESSIGGGAIAVDRFELCVVLAVGYGFGCGVLEGGYCCGCDEWG